MNIAQGWITMVTSLMTLIVMLYGIIKIVNKNEREWIQRDDKLSIIDKDVSVLKSKMELLIGIDTKMSEMKEEVTRMRNRLDTFLDTRTMTK